MVCTLGAPATRHRCMASTSGTRAPWLSYPFRCPRVPTGSQRSFRKNAHVQALPASQYDRHNQDSRKGTRNMGGLTPEGRHLNTQGWRESIVQAFVRVEDAVYAGL